jgi:hypothetical protein
MTRVVLISMRSHDRERSPAPHDDADKQIPGWAKIARTKRRAEARVASACVRAESSCAREPQCERFNGRLSLPAAKDTASGSQGTHCGR